MYTIEYYNNITYFINSMIFSGRSTDTLNYDSLNYNQYNGNVPTNIYSIISIIHLKIFAILYCKFIIINTYSTLQNVLIKCV